MAQAIIELHDVGKTFRSADGHLRPVLDGVDFTLREGEIVALLGRNGSGRSTTVKAIMGLVDSTGPVRWRDQEVLGRKAFEIAHAGIGYVPENRDIFPKLTVHQNLLLGEKRGKRDPRRALIT